MLPTTMSSRKSSSTALLLGGILVAFGAGAFALYSVSDGGRTPRSAPGDLPAGDAAVGPQPVSEQSTPEAGTAFVPEESAAALSGTPDPGGSTPDSSEVQPAASPAGPSVPSISTRSSAVSPGAPRAVRNLAPKVKRDPNLRIRGGRDRGERKRRKKDS